MLIGAGEMCELAAKHFVNNGVSEVLVTNRTFSRAQKLAADFSGSAVPFESFQDELHRADIVLSSTGSPNYVLTASQLKEVGKARRYRPMFIIDIAVPRDIDPAANKLNNLYLYDVDDLQGVVQSNMKERQKEAVKAEKIIDEEVAQFESWLATLEVKPTIVALRQQMEEMRRSEIDRTLAQLHGLGEDEKRAIDTLTSALINKILHHPTKILKQTSRDPEGNSYVEAVRILFDLQSVSAPDLDTDDVNE
jgi:glutamyl-tRNA reductase